MPFPPSKKKDDDGTLKKGALAAYLAKTKASGAASGAKKEMAEDNDDGYDDLGSAPEGEPCPTCGVSYRGPVHHGMDVGAASAHKNWRRKTGI